MCRVAGYHVFLLNRVKRFESNYHAIRIVSLTPSASCRHGNYRLYCDSRRLQWVEAIALTYSYTRVITSGYGSNALTGRAPFHGDGSA